MKLAWFSPLPPEQTEIGNVTARILPTLASRFDLTVYTGNESWNSSADAVCPIKSFTARTINWKELHRDGLPVYHVGNHIHFHGEIIAVARSCPGIIVLHDLALHETILNLCLEKGGGLAQYFDILCRYGGPDAVQHGQDFLENRVVNNDKLVMEYPLFEYVVRNARGVITHNPLNVGPIREATRAPVLYAPLPYLNKGDFHPPIDRTSRKREVYNIVVFGFLTNPNRRLRQIMEAFAESGVSDRFRITIAGKYDERDLRTWARELKIKSSVTLKGYLPDAGLDTLLEESDLCINLRWPSRGESSATQLRLWNFSLPSIVTRIAYYSTLPENTVAMVDPDNEKPDLIRHLQQFAADPEAFFRAGEAGRKLLEEQHSAEAFADHLSAFLPSVEDSRGNSYLQSFGRRLARDFLTDYADPSARSALAKRCAGELAQWA
ncbi:MAG: glycosyltransferase [Puniceicoccaceae bacterium]